MKTLNPLWEEGNNYIVERVGRFSGSGLIKVNLLKIRDKTLEFSHIPVQDNKSFLLRKSDFGFWGDWEFIEKI